MHTHNTHTHTTHTRTYTYAYTDTFLYAVVINVNVIDDVTGDVLNCYVSKPIKLPELTAVSSV